MKKDWSIGAMAALLVCGAFSLAAQETDSQLSKAEIAELFPGIVVEAVREGPIDGLYEISVGSQVAYVSKDGRFLVQGEIIDMNSNVNLTEHRRGEARLAVMSAIGEDTMIVFSPAEEARHTITVFTDIDCTYCRRLHQEMDQINALGVSVRYMFYPRSGPGTASWVKANEVWCSGNRNSALTDAKNGQTIDSAECGQTPVQTHYDLGQSVGLRGTPAIVTESGYMFSGFAGAENLLARVEQLEATGQE